MRVFALAEFDPASVVLSHRDALRLHGGVDLRLAVHAAYTRRQRQADWTRVQFDHYDRKTDRTEYTEQPLDPAMLDFASEAEVFQIAPGIGQPWASEDQAPRYGTADEPPLSPYLGVVWKDCFAAAKTKVAFFHGSRCCWANRPSYANHYRQLGCTLATSTLDYAVELDATWLPPTVPGRWQRGTSSPEDRAPLRGDDDPLVVAHTPTDPSNCGTAEFMRLAASLGIVVQFVTNAPPEDAIAAKTASHAVYDHMRGSFSMNTLEGMALGCVPLVGVTERCWTRMGECGFDPLEPRIADFNGLAAWLRQLRDSPALTRSLQESTWQYAREQFGAKHIAEHLTRFYEGVTRA